MVGVMLVQPRLSDLSAVLAVLLLTHCCGGQRPSIGSPQPLVAMLGDDVILPCHLEPGVDAVSMAAEWARADLNPRFVHVRRDGVELLIDQNPAYIGRTSMPLSRLRAGDLSLKLSGVKRSDVGTYRCYIPKLERGTEIQLFVGAVSSPAIAISKDSFRCESAGWFPEPEVLWLDGEGKLLSAGPPETTQSPDGLYTVSSRVTVEKHSSSFTCRVQQKDVNQTREAHIQVPDDLFAGSSCHVHLAVSGAVCLLLLLAVVLLAWRYRRNGVTKADAHRDEEIPFKPDQQDQQDQPDQPDAPAGPEGPTPSGGKDHVVTTLESHVETLKDSRKTVESLLELMKELIEEQDKKQEKKYIASLKAVEKIMKRKDCLENHKIQLNKLSENIKKLVKGTEDLIGGVESQKTHND